jgi:PQQ-like domain
MSAVFLTGSTKTGSSYALATVVYSSATGAPLWTAAYDADAYGSAAAVAFSPDVSRVFVTGDSTSNVNFAGNYLTVGYDASTGARLWTRREIGGDYTRGARAVGVSRDGSTVFVTGSVNRPAPTGLDYLTVAYGAVGGKRRWKALYDGDARSDDRAYALAVSPDGAHVFVTGASYPSATGSSDIATVAYPAGPGRAS